MRTQFIKGYDGIVSALTIQSPRISALTQKPVVQQGYAYGLMKKLVSNESEYRAFRNLNAKASTANLRLNMRFPEDAQGKIALDVADESMPTDREFVSIAAKIFTDKVKNVIANIKDTAETLATALKSEKKGGTKTILFDPSKKFSHELSDAIDEVIVNRELAKH